MGKDYLNRLPDYNNCLVNLANSILKRFDVETTASTLPLADEYLKKDYKNVVVLLLTRDEVLENKVFGPGQDRDGLGEMIGDYVAFSVSKSSIFVAHLEAQMMPGGHAGLTEEEIAIPLIAVEL